MTSEKGARAPGGRFAALKVYAQPRMATMLALGFASGMPFLLLFSTLSIWLREVGISRTSIGLMFYAGLAYVLKFVWAPALDQVRVPVLSKRFGKRRAWILVAQPIVIIALIGMAFCDPATRLLPLALFAVVLGFAGATQDICIDAWRIEAAPKAEQGAMAASYQLGYRFAALAAGAGALYVAQFVSWRAAYLSMALLMLIGVAAALLAPTTPEPEEPVAREEKVGALAARMHFGGAIADGLRWAYRAIIAPFVDFFTRYSWMGLVMLALIGLYRLPDFVMGVMARPLYVDLGFSLSTIATITTILGVWITIAGAVVGGLAVARFGIMRTLLAGVIVTICGNLVFSWLATQPNSTPAFVIAIIAENLASGFAGTALIAYMSSLTSTHFTATQYALFSSFYALPGKLLGGGSGYIVDWFSAHRYFYAGIFGGLAGISDKIAGYVPFFIITAAMGVPALLLVLFIYRREGERRHQKA